MNHSAFQWPYHIDIEMARDAYGWTDKIRGQGIHSEFHGLSVVLAHARDELQGFPPEVIVQLQVANDAARDTLDMYKKRMTEWCDSRSHDDLVSLLASRPRSHILCGAESKATAPWASLFSAPPRDLKTVACAPLPINNVRRIGILKEMEANGKISPKRHLWITPAVRHYKAGNGPGMAVCPEGTVASCVSVAHANHFVDSTGETHWRSSYAEPPIFFGASRSFSARIANLALCFLRIASVSPARTHVLCVVGPCAVGSQDSRWNDGPDLYASSNATAGTLARRKLFNQVAVKMLKAAFPGIEIVDFESITVRAEGPAAPYHISKKEKRAAVLARDSWWRQRG